MNLLFAWRYFRAKKSTNAINIIAWVSMVAIVCITASFMVLLSVFNGFDGFVKSLYSSFYADIRVGPREGKTITVSTDQLMKLKDLSSVAAYSLIVEEKSLLQNGDIQTIVQLKGVDQNYTQVTGVENMLLRGTFNLGDGDEAALVLGSGIENALGLQSDRNLYPVTAYLFKPGVNVNVIDPFQAFSAENLGTSGTFFIQQDIDNKFALTNLAFMKKMLGMAPDEFGSVEIAVGPEAGVEQVRESLRSIFSEGYVIESRYEQNKSMFSVMSFEKWIIYGVLTLMLVVAAFTMIGALTMLVLEKQKDIQVLKAMGAGNSRIGSIFLLEGLLLAGLGAGAGSLLAVLICWAQVEFKLVSIDGGTFLIDYYPVEMIPSDFFLVLFTVMLVGLLASWFPARRAASQAIELRSDA